MGCKQLQLNNQFFFVDSDEKEPHPCKFVFIRGSEESLSSDHTFVSSVSSVCAYSYNATRNIAYTYDGLNRLTKEVSECADKAELDYTSEYTYDLVGNR